MKTKFNPVMVILLAVTFIFSACNDDDDEVMDNSMSIVEVAQEAGQFSMLIEAAQLAGLDAFLATEDNLTVFAPTDEAFTALMNNLGISSLSQVPASALQLILSYHVVGNKTLSSQLTNGYVPTLATFSGNNISMLVETGNGVSINGDVTVTSADIEADNGVIHVVDKVILPPTVVDIALANNNFTTLVAAVAKAGLVDDLSGAGPFTVFAPTNAAFDDLFSQLGISGIDALTAEQLIPILTYHVVSGNVLSTGLSAGDVTTLNGGALTIDLSGGVMINESNVTAADIQGANGVVHVIDKVLLPE